MYFRKRFYTILIISLALGALYLNSTTLIRVKLANYYTRTKHYNEAINAYNKIIRKEKAHLKPRVHDSIFLSGIHFILSELYSRKNMKNLAIEEYVNAFKMNPQIDEPVFLFSNDPLDYRRLAMAFLESGNFDQAIKYFIKIQGHFFGDMEIEKYIFIAKEMKAINPQPVLNDDFYFSIGEQYIAKELWAEAKVFFTKRITKNVGPVEVLRYLNKRYNLNEKSEIRNKVWGENLYVSLEDFEDSKAPVFVNGPSDAKSTVRSHEIARGISHGGNCSEYFDLTYAIERYYDYWVKTEHISISIENLPLSVRLFVKSAKPFRGDLRLIIAYPVSSVQGVINSQPGAGSITADWRLLKIEDVLKKAKVVGQRFKWNTSKMEIVGVVVNTGADTNQFYIDDIELFLN